MRGRYFLGRHGGVRGEKAYLGVLRNKEIRTAKESSGEPFLQRTWKGNLMQRGMLCTKLAHGAKRAFLRG